MYNIISKKISAISILLVFISFIISQAQNQSIESDIFQVENSLLPYVIIEGEPSFNIYERMKHYNVPGISITVIRDNKIEWTKSYGVMDSDLENPVLENTLFSVGSLSKAVASLAALRLVEEGKVKLRGEVNEQLSSWQIPENEFTSKGRITPLLLMNHSSGAMHYPGVPYLENEFPTNLQVLKGEKPSKFRPVEIDRIPGTQFQYSNAGYGILQHLIEDVSGQKYNELVKEQIFDKLDMKSATLNQPLPKGLIKFAAAAHRNNGEPFEGKRFYIQPAAAGGLWTTSSDYAKFVIELQKAYRGESNEIISQATAKEMLSPHVSKQYGLGVFMREIHGEVNYFGHLGDNRGFFAGFISHFTEGYGVVILTNSQNGAKIIREITKAVAKVYNWEKFLPKAEKLVPISSNNFDEYCGRYSLGSDECFRVSKDNGNLYLDKFGKLKLYHVGNGKFVTKSRLGFLQFNKNSNSKNTNVVFHFADELGRFLSNEKNCLKMEPEEKLPIEYLQEGKTQHAADLYRIIKKSNSSDKYISENRFNRLGYYFINKEKLSEAIEVFKLNVEFYPKSANCYDSLGEAYMRNGNNELAIVNYKKALELNPENQNAVLMLEKLK